MSSETIVLGLLELLILPVKLGASPVFAAGCKAGKAGEAVFQGLDRLLEDAAGGLGSAKLRRQEERRRIDRRIDAYLRDMARPAEAGKEEDISLFGEAVLKSLTQDASGMEEASVPSPPPVRQAPAAGSAPAGDPGGGFNLRELHARLSLLDREEGARLAPLVDEAASSSPERASALSVQLKLAAGRASERLAEEILRRKELLEAAAELGALSGGEVLAADMRAAAAGPPEGLEAFDALMGRYRAASGREAVRAALAAVPGLEEAAASATGEELSRAFGAATLAGELRRKGFTLYGEDGKRLFGEEGVRVVTAGGRPFLDIGLGGGYYLMADRVPDGKARLRLIRAVADVSGLEDRSEAQRLRDGEASAKWCGRLEELSAALRAAGHPAEYEIRKGAGEELTALVIPALASTGSGEALPGAADAARRREAASPQRAKPPSAAPARDRDERVSRQLAKGAGGSPAGRGKA